MEEIAPHGSPASAPLRAATWCLRVSIALVCLGAAVSSLKYEGPLFSLLFITFGFSEQTALVIEHGGAWLLLLLAPLILWSRAWPALIFVALWMSVQMAAKVFDEAWHPELIPVEQALRCFSPLALALLLAFPKAGTIPARRIEIAFWMLRAFIAATFLGHGLEALLLKSEFRDFIFAAGTMLSMEIQPATADFLLQGIGCVDVLVAVAVLMPLKLRSAAAWMAFWGLVTAGARIVHSGWAANYPEALLRLVHCGAPLALLLYWQLSRTAERATTPTRSPRRARLAALGLAGLTTFALGFGDVNCASAPPSTHAIGHLRVIWTEHPQSRATISWSTSAPGAKHVVYYDARPRRKRLSKYQHQQPADRNGQFSGEASVKRYYHHARLTGLAPSTTYYFVVTGDDLVSREFHFFTAPAADVPFKILSGGDSRSSPANRRGMNRRISELAAADPKILALAHGGDYVAKGTNLSQWVQWLSDHELTITSKGRVLPIIPARGNHEKSGPLFDEVFDRPGGDKRKNYFATRLSPKVLLVTLNTETSFGGRQARFLEQTLQGSLVAGVRWKLVQFHKPAYPAVKKPSSARQHWVPLFEKYNVDLACTADGHAIKRTPPIRKDKVDPTGVVYIGEGGLGVKQRTPKKDRWYLQPPGKVGRGHHVFVLSFTSSALEIRTILMNGSEFDRHSIKVRDKRMQPVGVP